MIALYGSHKKPCIFERGFDLRGSERVIVHGLLSDVLEGAQDWSGAGQLFRITLSRMKNSQNSWTLRTNGFPRELGFAVVAYLEVRNLLCLSDDFLPGYLG